MLQIAIIPQTTCDDIANISITQGDTLAMYVQILQNLTTPLDITGASIRMTIAFPTPLILSTANGSIIIVDPENGIFTINIASTVTAALPIGAYSYDLWIENESSPIVENQYFNGSFTITASITEVP